MLNLINYKKIYNNIIDNYDIVDYIYEKKLLKLKRTSNLDEYTAVCPFHDDVNPSLFINRKKQVFHCFGCEMSGNIIHFVKNYFDLKSNFQSVKILNDNLINNPDEFNNNKRNRLFNESLNQEMIREKNEKLKLELDIDLIYKLLEESHKFYKEQTLNNQFLKEYIVNTRGFNFKVINKYEIGITNDSISNVKTLTKKGKLSKRVREVKGISLLNYLLKKFNLDLVEISNSQQLNNFLIHCEEASLITKNIIKDIKNPYGYIDKFRNRIIFSIRNETNKVIGFMGRATKDNILNKYLNSSTTILFKKKNSLYFPEKFNKSKSKNNICIITEGIFDSIRLNEIKLKSDKYDICSIMGIALNEELLKNKLFKNYNTLILALDNDNAGILATKKIIIKSLPYLRRLKELKFLILNKENKDPDEYFKNNVKLNTITLVEYLNYLAKNQNISFQTKITHFLKDIKLKIPNNIKLLEKLILSEISYLTNKSLKEVYSIILHKKPSFGKNKIVLFSNDVFLCFICSILRINDKNNLDSINIFKNNLKLIEKLNINKKEDILINTNITNDINYFNFKKELFLNILNLIQNKDFKMVLNTINNILNERLLTELENYNDFIINDEINNNKFNQTIFHFITLIIEDKKGINN